MEWLQAFAASEAGTALQGLLIVAFADFATGTFAAIRDDTFAMEAVAAWVRKHIAGRVGPIGTLLLLAYFAGGTASTLFLVGAVAAGAAYIAETMASIWGNLNPPKAADVKDNTAAAALNPVPQD